MEVNNSMSPQYSSRDCKNVLSIEWISIRFSGNVHGIVSKTVHKTVHKTMPGSQKTEPCAVISSQISSRLTGEVVITFFTASTCAFGVNVVNCPEL